MTNEPDGIYPPYLPYSTFRTALEALQQGFPPKLDRSLWPSQSGGTQSLIIKAFRFLGFTGDGDAALPILQNYMSASPEDRKKVLGDMLIAAYPKIIDLASANGSTQQLHDAFGVMGVQGDTRRKAETFFLQAAEDTGLRLSTFWPATKKRAAAKSPRRSGTRSGTRTTRNRQNDRTDPPRDQNTQQPPPAGNTKVITFEGGGTMTLSVSVDVMTLSRADRTFVFDVIDKLNEYDGEGGSDEG